MSLRDQLLKAGLVSQEKVKQVEADARKETHAVKKNKNLAAAEVARQAEQQRQREAEAEKKRERDRQLNQEREAEKKRKEERDRMRQLIESHRLNEANADILYNFTEGRFIRRVRVTAAQQKQLAAGQIGIVRNRDDKFDFPLLPRETVQKIGEIRPQDVLLLHPEGGVADDDEGWDA